jgi:hypothetical protein
VGVGERKRRKERKRAKVDFAICGGSGEKWLVTLWPAMRYAFPQIFPSGGKMGEVGEVV